MFHNNPGQVTDGISTGEKPNNNPNEGKKPKAVLSLPLFLSANESNMSRVDDEAIKC